MLSSYFDHFGANFDNFFQGFSRVLEFSLSALEVCGLGESQRRSWSLNPSILTITRRREKEKMTRREPHFSENMFRFSLIVFLARWYSL